MRAGLYLVALLAGLLAAPSVQAQSEPADSNIKGALFDIERAEQQIQGLTPSRKANIKRMQNSLAITEERLAASPHRDDPSWIEANERLQALKTALAQLAGGGSAAGTGATTGATTGGATTGSGGATTGTGGATSQTVQPAQTAQTAADPTLRRLQSELAMIGKQVGGLKPGDHGVAARHIGDTLRVGQELAAYPDREDPAWQEAIQLYGQINNHLIDVMAPSWQQDLMSTAETIGAMAPLDYMDAQRVDYVRQRLNGLFNSMQYFQNPQNPVIAQTTQALIQVGTEFEKRVEQAAAQQTALGDYAGQIEAILRRARAIEVPAALTTPVGEDEVRAFAGKIAAIRSQVEQDLAYLENIDGKAPLTVEQINDLRAARSELAYSAPGEIEQTLFQSDDAIDAWVADRERIMNQLAAVDPHDSNDQANRLLGEGSFEENLKRLDEGLTAAKVAAAYDGALGRSGTPARAAQQRAFEDAIAAFKEKRQLALDSKRMPEAQSDDPELLAAAAEVLKRPQYGFDFDRLVINYDVQRKERTEGEIETGAVVSTLTATHYVWDEFQATTAEKVGDDYYLFVNEFHFYHAADSTVPTGKWVLHDRFQSSQILPENIDR